MIVEVYVQLFKTLAELVTNASRDTEAVGKTKDLAKISDEAQRQELELRMAEAQARVTQELAIANRIENAEEVEIEEFYDTSGKGATGLRVEEGGATVGLSGSGRRVVRRVYRFKRNLSSPDGN